jgi:hypothetical protein
MRWVSDFSIASSQHKSPPMQVPPAAPLDLEPFEFSFQKPDNSRLKFRAEQDCVFFA